MKNLEKTINLSHQSKTDIRGFLGKIYKSQQQTIERMNQLGFTLQSIQDWSTFDPNGEEPMRYKKAWIGHGIEDVSSVSVLAAFHFDEIIKSGLSIKQDQQSEKVISNHANKSPYLHHAEENMISTKK